MADLSSILIGETGLAFCNLKINLYSLSCKDGEKNISVFLLQTLNTSFDNVSDLFILYRVIMVNMD